MQSEQRVIGMGESGAIGRLDTRCACRFRIICAILRMLKAT